MCRSCLMLAVLLACATQPAHARQSPPAAAYDSAFAGYKAYAEPKVANWKQTNAIVAALPGHRAHAGHDMSAMAPGATADPHAGHDMSKMQPAAAAAPADPHAGHDMSKMQPASTTRTSQPARPAVKVKAPTPVKLAKPDPHADHQHH